MLHQDLDARDPHLGFHGVGSKEPFGGKEEGAGQLEKLYIFLQLLCEPAGLSTALKRRTPYGDSGPLGAKGPTTLWNFRPR